MANLLILGAGAMGSALTVPAAERGNRVGLWFTEFDMEIYKILTKGGTHPRIGIKLPESIELYKPEELEIALRKADLLIIAVSSQGVQPISKRLKEKLGDHPKPVSVVSKGVEVIDNKPMTMAEVASFYLGKEHVVYVSGPSLAGELAAKSPTHTVYSSFNEDVARRFKEVLETDYYRIQTSNDIIGSSLCAALKNPYAIAYGILDGMSSKKGLNNLKAAFLTYTLKEMVNIIEASGGSRETVYGLPGFGDLYVTAMGGRNSMFGRLIGSGLSVKEALDNMKRKGLGVVEGYRNSKTLVEYVKSRGMGRESAPLLYTINDVLHSGAPKERIIEVLKEIS